MSMPGRHSGPPSRNPLPVIVGFAEPRDCTRA